MDEDCSRRLLGLHVEALDPWNQYLPDNQKAARYVLEHYFVARRQSRVLLRNGIARLWWTAHLSRDEARKDPYELIEVLLSSFDITQQALERNWRRSHVVLHAFLEFLMKHKAILLAGGNKNRAQIRRLAKFLNWHGGVCLLDFLGKNEIVVLLEGEFSRI